jgi:transcriptional regulator with XRE-family HTH domain
MPYGSFHDISARIRKVRGELKKAKFADILGIPRPNYYKYEDGRKPPADVLQKIADYGGVTVKWLLTGKEEKEKNLDRPILPDQPSVAPESQRPGEIQEFLFAQVLRAFEEYQDSLGIVYDRAHRARVLVALYNHCARELELPSFGLVEKIDTDLA